ncbi:MAG: KGG domain-containing protein [Noviherbaspirillum sp.]
MASNKQDEQARSGGSRRGFAAMDPELQRAIASAGGRAAHRSGNAHEFTPEEARHAGSLSRKNSANRASEQAGDDSVAEPEASNRKLRP